MGFSHFLKRMGCVVAMLIGTVLAMPAWGQSAGPTPDQATPLEAGKRPASLSAPPAASASVQPTEAFEPDPDLTPAALKARYPVQSITTMELANEALADVKQGRKQVEAIFKRDEKACYKIFLANRCVAKVKDNRRVSINELRKIQVEAERFKRHAAAVKRDQALEKNRLKAEGGESGRTPEEKRAANEAAFEKKTRDREAAQEKVIEKRARTERRRQKKAAEAAKRARLTKPSASASASTTTLAPAPSSAQAGASSSAASVPPSAPSSK